MDEQQDIRTSTSTGTAPSVTTGGATAQLLSEKAVKVLIAEDDVVQRTALVDLVTSLRPQWRIVATVSTVAEVNIAVDSLIPDLCLIDIHLSGTDDSSWIKTLAWDQAIIYVTGDPDHAVHAFDSNAVDYVLKPITARRLKAALERAEQDPRLGARQQSAADGNTGQPYLSRITMSRGPDTLVVMRDDIVFLEADAKYTRVATLRSSGLVRVGLNELSSRLPSDQFVRIHRSHIVNLRFIERVKRNDLGHLEVHLNGRPEVLRVSKPHEYLFRSD
jgi:DNA-binding LytR/AlgR family response regulator